MDPPHRERYGPQVAEPCSYPIGGVSQHDMVSHTCALTSAQLTAWRGPSEALQTSVCAALSSWHSALLAPWDPSSISSVQRPHGCPGPSAPGPGLSRASCGAPWGSLPTSRPLSCAGGGQRWAAVLSPVCWLLLDRSVLVCDSALTNLLASFSAFEHVELQGEVFDFALA